jgi:hypothetical protein
MRMDFLFGVVGDIDKLTEARPTSANSSLKAQIQILGATTTNSGTLEIMRMFLGR